MSIDLPAGRDLDARIAQEVLGWYVIGHLCDPAKRPDALGDACEEVPAFSTDPAAAWLLAEHFCGRFLGLSLDCRHAGTGWPAPWRCRIVASKNERQEVRVTAYGATMPEAVCRAALLSVEAK